MHVAYFSLKFLSLLASFSQSSALWRNTWSPVYAWTKNTSIVIIVFLSYKSGILYNIDEMHIASNHVSS